MRRLAMILAVCASLGWHCAQGGGAWAHAALEPVPPHTQAKSAVLVDVNTGRVLMEKNAHTPMRIASITKIMTAILAIEYGELSKKVTVSRHATYAEGSSVYLKENQRIPLKDLLYGLMLRSGNDAAVAIAEHIAGSEENFSILMNIKAMELGMRNTHFRNPHGLDTAEDHYSSAFDMAVLTAYALKNPVFQEIVKTTKYRVSFPGEQWDTVWYNKNKMLNLYEGADGVKTGYTKRAGRTLVSSATRNGQQLVAVTLNDPDDWRDHRALLDWGFENYPLRTLLQKGQEVPTPPLWEKERVKLRIAHNFQYPLTEEEIQLVETRIILQPLNARQLRKSRGKEVGQVVVSLRGEQIGRVPIILR